MSLRKEQPGIKQQTEHVPGGTIIFKLLAHQIAKSSQRRTGIANTNATSRYVKAENAHYDFSRMLARKKRILVLPVKNKRRLGKL